MLKSEERNAKDNKGAAMELHIAKKLFEKKLDAAKERERALQDRLHEAQDNQHGAEDKIREQLEKEISTLKSENSLLKYDKNALSSKLRQVEKDASDARQNSNAAQSANHEIEKLRSSHETEIKNARHEIDRLNRSLNGLGQEYDQYKRRTNNQMERMYDQHQLV